MINEKIVPISPYGFRFPTETEMAIDETLKLCGISEENASMITMEVMKKLGKSDEIPTCCIDLGGKMTREEAVARIKDHIEMHRYHERNAVKIFEALDMAIKALEQHEPNYDEWCTDCKEYDKEKHSCPRWNRVIRQTLVDAQPEPCEDAVSRKAAIAQMQGLPKWNGIIADSCVDFEDVISVLENKENLPPVTPKQRIGKWIPSDSQCGIRCPVCGVPVDDFCHSIDYIDLDYEPNFCPHCGVKMRGTLWK